MLLRPQTPLAGRERAVSVRQQLLNIIISDIRICRPGCAGRYLSIVELRLFVTSSNPSARFKDLLASRADTMPFLFPVA